MNTSASLSAAFKPLRVIGLMSGTSMDGIDAAYMETDGEDIVRCEAAVTVPYDGAFRQRLAAFIKAAPDRGAASHEGAIETELTDLHAAAVFHLLKAMGVTPSAVDLIGFHGQTIWHRPARRATWQMGDGGRLADILGVPVAFDFRTADVAAGGQGAPLVPVYHAALARAQGLPTAILNIGGVANITWVGTAGELLAFDTGPGNGLINDWVESHNGQAMDKDGEMAAKGKADQALVARLLEHPFFSKHPPKSLDRFEFSTANFVGTHFAHFSPEDGAATLTAFTAAAVARALKHCPIKPQRLLVAGGGRHNPSLMREIERAVGIPVAPVDGLGWDGDALEAQAFAYLAVRCLRGLPLTFPTTTGTPMPLTGGRLVQPAAQTRSVQATSVQAKSA